LAGVKIGQVFLEDLRKRNFFRKKVTFQLARFDPFVFVIQKKNQLRLNAFG
jgi:hypothetical protein